MAFSKIQEYITTDTGTAGELLIPKIIFPKLIDEVNKILLPRELAAMVIKPGQWQGVKTYINLEDPNTMDVRETAEGAEIGMDAGGYVNVELEAKKYGVAIRITREMMEDSQFELLQRQIRLAGKRFAEKETELIIDELNTCTNSVTGGATVTISNLTEAMNTVEGNDYTPTDVIAGDDVIWDLRNIDTFAEADKHGGRDAYSLTGWVGVLYGLRIHRFSRNATSTPTTFKLYAWVFDRSQAYVIGIKRNLTVENFDLPSYDMQGAAITMRMDVELLRDYAICKITTS